MILKVIGKGFPWAPLFYLPYSLLLPPFWRFPNYENAETFIDLLFLVGLLVCEPTVDAALLGRVEGLSLRSVQRRFRRATGLSHETVRQIERARQAAALLEQGVSILDTVHEAGYADQPHLTRSLKRLLGQTPAQIQQSNYPGIPVVFIQDRNAETDYYSDAGDYS